MGSTQQCLDSSGTFHRFWVVNQGCKISAGNWRQIEEMQLRKKGEEAEDFGSLESLCQVWKLSTDQHPPHICKILSINGGGRSYNSSQASWQPLSQAVDSFATNRNIGISTVLIAIFSILLVIAIYLKYRKKVVEEDQLELDNLTRELSICKTPGYQDVPPDYQAVVMNSLHDDSDSLPDYEDDVVEKVMV